MGLNTWEMGLMKNQSFVIATIVISVVGAVAVAELVFWMFEPDSTRSEAVPTWVGNRTHSGLGRSHGRSPRS